MDEEKYKKLHDILSNIDENEYEKYEQVKYLFKRFIFLENQIVDKKSLWFEKDEIKQDSEYYEVIIKIIDSFLKYCFNKEAFKVEQLSKEINNIFLNSKFWIYYFNIMEISKILGLFEENFTEIASGLLCLGFKKESEIYSSFVETIKEFVLDERIQNTRYSSLLVDIDYQNIDGAFLSNLNSLLSLILNNANEENIKLVIKKLKKAEDLKEQRISSVSTNFENNGSEENKFEVDNNKKGQQLVSISQNSPLIQQESLLNSQNSPLIQQESLLNSQNSPLIQQENLLISQNSPLIQQESLLNVQNSSDKIQNSSYLLSKNEISESDEKDTSKLKENSSSNSEEIPKDKEENVKNSENETTELNIQQEKYSAPKTGLSGLNEEKNEIINEVNLDDSFEQTKQIFENKGDIEDNENTEEKKKENHLEELVMNKVLSVVQRFNRYFLILEQHSKFINALKERDFIESLNNEIYEGRAYIEKLEIQLNEMKAIIKYLLPANIVNIKRKILDLVIFSILKQNKDSFVLKDGYCPNENFLDRLKDKLTKLYKQNNLSEDKKQKINDRLQFINEQKSIKNTVTVFPLSCPDTKLDSIMKFFSFYKKECNDIVHISKEALRYYLFPLNKDLDPRLKDLFNSLMNINVNNMNNNSSQEKKGNSVEKEINEKDSSFKNPPKIDVDIAFEILLGDKFGNDAYVSEIEKKLEEIDLKRKEFLVKFTETRKSGYKKLLFSTEKNIGQTLIADSVIFSEKEKSFIIKSEDEFKSILTNLKKKLDSLGGCEKEKNNFEIINDFFDKFNEIYKSQLNFDQEKLLLMCETAKGEKERRVLVYLTIKLSKYKAVNVFFKDITKILNHFYEKEKNGILKLLRDLKKQTKELIIEATKLTQIKSANLLYRKWKFSNLNYKNVNFGYFVSLIRNYVTSIEAKFNDDIISDQVTSFWMIKNNLSDYIE